ncbi:MAG: carcinine hydrolase/isopenicillin-N N-acyltransferase family protein [Prevotellaceae bacterium]|nr:carcinine hydrolase/isopenicillin-N N-acyltransferase family protein [Prevotellaceae bacterium]MDY3855518.1 carcinine hydrolase/isopenicillin-N N-acyltransferase family protein [Bacteroidaceae bacterium]
MAQIKRLSLLLILLCTLLLVPTFSRACTSIIISGKATPDGRPILLKNRDTGTLSNMCVVCQGVRYRFLGLVNAKDAAAKEVWAGHNEAGFAIMNTAAYNLNAKDEKLEKEGILMRQALSQCATLADFEQMLDTLSRPMCVDANFGVLDAQGGCAYYEVGNQSYRKYDANDSVTAPGGYLIRTNYGMSGDMSDPHGVERYAAISELMAGLHAHGAFDIASLLTIPHYLRHGVTHTDLLAQMPADAETDRMVCFRDYIPRYITASCMLIQGVASGQNPAQTTSWTYVGYPLTTVAVPLMITRSGHLPAIVSPDQEGRSWLATEGLRLKGALFCLKQGNTHDYLNLSRLVNRDGTGILQLTKPVQDSILAHSHRVLGSLSRREKPAKSIDALYDWIDAYVKSQMLAIDSRVMPHD